MNLHEYQAKALFQQYGIPVPRFSVIDQAAQATTTATELGGKRWVAKAQVHAGGRGKAGGVRVIEDMHELEGFASQLIGSRLVTHQTGVEGQPIHQVLIEQPCDIERELYLFYLFFYLNIPDVIFCLLKAQDSFIITHYY